MASLAVKQVFEAFEMFVIYNFLSVVLSISAHYRLLNKKESPGS